MHDEEGTNEANQDSIPAVNHHRARGCDVHVFDSGVFAVVTRKVISEGAVRGVIHHLQDFDIDEPTHRHDLVFPVGGLHFVLTAAKNAVALVLRVQLIDKVIGFLVQFAVNDFATRHPKQGQAKREGEFHEIKG
jgi:hypothetical protein